MLQAVVAHDDVATRLRERARGGDAIAVDAHLRAGADGDQHGFVAAFSRCGLGSTQRAVFGSARP